MEPACNGSVRPTSCENFFWASMINSVRSNAAICFCVGSGTVATGPRRVAGPCNSPRRCAVRQNARCDEYNPSRRNNAPSSPGFVQASAAARICSLYAALNCRRVRVADTPVSCCATGSTERADDTGTTSITLVQ